MPVWQAVLLGVVQGLTEFLPISSTAHLLVAQELLGRSPEQIEKDPFTVVVQLGTLVAVLAYFWRDVVALAGGFLADVATGQFLHSGSPEGRAAKYIIVGTVPVVVVGLLLKKWLKATFYNAPAIAVVAVVFALLMLAAELYAKWRAKRVPPREEAGLSWADAIVIGLAQALALMPGASRSGTTITAGLFAGVSRGAAARFSFLLSLPSVFAAGVKDLYDWVKELKASPEAMAQASDQAVAMLVGSAVAGVVGYASIAWLLGYLRKYPMTVFVIYRLALAAAIGAWLWAKAHG